MTVLPGKYDYLAALPEGAPPPRPNAAGTLVTVVTVPRKGLGDWLDDVSGWLCRYVAFPSEHEPVAVALWIAHAWLAERFETSPILAITSAEMRSGKTRLLECLTLLVPNPEPMLLPSEAVAYTLLGEHPRKTLLLDEADAIFGPRTADKYEGIRAILNSGNRQGVLVKRVRLTGKRRGIEAFDVFGPKVVAGIGNLPDTITDRAIPIRMKRRTLAEPVTRFRRRQAEHEAALLAFDWSKVIGLSLIDVTLPDELPDRQADSWEPLLIVANLAGPEWVRRGRLAAIALSGAEELNVTTGIRLLADIRDAFGDADHLPTHDLLDHLNALEDAPWGDWYGKPLTARALARLLDPYRVRPLLKRVADGRERGYFAADFEDAWARYVPIQEPVTRVTSVPDERRFATDPVPDGMPF